MRNFTFAAILASFVTHALAASAQPAPQRPASGPRLAEAATAMPVVPAGTVTLTLAGMRPSGGSVCAAGPAA